MRHLILVGLAALGALAAAPASAQPNDVWLKEAYEGNRIAQRHIAESFENGTNGFPVSLILAYRWYSLAAISKDRAAEAGLARVKARLSEAQIQFARSGAPITSGNFETIFAQYGYNDGLSPLLGVMYQHKDIRSEFGSWCEPGSQLSESEWAEFVSDKYSACGASYSHSTKE